MNNESNQQQQTTRRETAKKGYSAPKIISKELLEIVAGTGCGLTPAETVAVACFPNPRSNA